VNATHIHHRSPGGQFYVRGQITNLAGQQLNVDDSFNDLVYDGQWAKRVDFAMFRIAAGTNVTPLSVSSMKTGITIPDGTISFHTNHEPTFTSLTGRPPRPTGQEDRRAIDALEALRAVGNPSGELSARNIFENQYIVFKFGVSTGWTAGELVAVTQLGYYVVAVSDSTPYN
jgi:hypothetical protein